MSCAVTILVELMMTGRAFFILLANPKLLHPPKMRIQHFLSSVKLILLCDVMYSWSTSGVSLYSFLLRSLLLCSASASPDMCVWKCTTLYFVRSLNVMNRSESDSSVARRRYSGVANTAGCLLRMSYRISPNRDKASISFVSSSVGLAEAKNTCSRGSES